MVNSYPTFKDGKCYLCVNNKHSTFLEAMPCVKKMSDIYVLAFLYGPWPKPFDHDMDYARKEIAGIIAKGLRNKWIPAYWTEKIDDVSRLNCTLPNYWSEILEVCNPWLEAICPKVDNSLLYYDCPEEDVVDYAHNSLTDNGETLEIPFRNRSIHLLGQHRVDRFGVTHFIPMYIIKCKQ